MEDRSNIIKEAIEYRDKLEKKVEELAQSVVRLQISLDFADNTIKKKDKENAELKAYMDVNEDFKTAWEELKAENDKLKSCLQEIKEIAEKECKDCLDKRSDSCWICPYYPILDLITKAESEDN